MARCTLVSTFQIIPGVAQQRVETFACVNSLCCPAHTGHVFIKHSSNPVAPTTPSALSRAPSGNDARYALSVYTSPPSVNPRGKFADETRDNYVSFRRRRRRSTIRRFAISLVPRLPVLFDPLSSFFYFVFLFFIIIGSWGFYVEISTAERGREREKRHLLGWDYGSLQRYKENIQERAMCVCVFGSKVINYNKVIRNIQCVCIMNNKNI